jgi:hypothetical protein
VTLARTIVSEERIASIIKVDRIRQLIRTCFTTAFLRSVLQLLVTADVVPSSLILSIQLVFLRSVLQLLLTANAVPCSLILSIWLVFLRSVLQLLVTANVVPSSLILSI